MSAVDRDALIAKVLKCLALSASSNEHEAAAALRQAQKLMQAHGISDLDIAHAHIQEESARAGAATRPAAWECELAQRVAGAFGCSVFLRIDYPAGVWVFVGVEPGGAIARYAFEVLFRQVRRAQRSYVRTALKRCTATRTRRADLFCAGWVSSATALIERFGGGDEQAAKVRAYLDHKSLKDFHGTDRNAGRRLTERDHMDWVAGRVTGCRAQLNRGVSGEAAPLALE